jgi:hypothetical protein
VLSAQLGRPFHVDHASPPPASNRADRARVELHSDASADAPGGSVLDRRRGVSFHPVPTLSQCELRQLVDQHDEAREARRASGLGQIIDQFDVGLSMAVSPVASRGVEDLDGAVWGRLRTRLRCHASASA